VTNASKLRRALHDWQTFCSAQGVGMSDIAGHHLRDLPLTPERVQTVLG
jgi:hypothetical protein